jgi:hypothetical protein
MKEQKKPKRIGEAGFYECAMCGEVCKYNRKDYPLCKKCKNEKNE